MGRIKLKAWLTQTVICYNGGPPGYLSMQEILSKLQAVDPERLKLIAGSVSLSHHADFARALFHLQQGKSAAEIQHILLWTDDYWSHFIDAAEKAMPLYLDAHRLCDDDLPTGTAAALQEEVAAEIHFRTGSDGVKMNDNSGQIELGQVGAVVQFITLFMGGMDGAMSQLAENLSNMFGRALGQAVGGELTEAEQQRVRETELLRQQELMREAALRAAEDNEPEEYQLTEADKQRMRESELEYQAELRWEEAMAVTEGEPVPG